MQKRHLIGNAYRTVPWAVLFVCILQGTPGRAQSQETLPPGSTESSDESATERDGARQRYCPPIEHRPLTALTVDTSPLNAEGQPIAADDMPQGCPPSSSPEAVGFLISYGPDCWNCHDLLQLARFCHPRLYFEDVMLERYGVQPVFPCLYSTSQFTCDLVLLPGRLMVNKRYPCVRTPTPHCWSGCRVCGF